MKGNRIQIFDVIKICGFAPSQWYLFSSRGRKFYVRYRHGNLAVRTKNKTIFDKDIYPVTGESVLITRQMFMEISNLFYFEGCNISGLDHWDKEDQYK